MERLTDSCFPLPPDTFNFCQLCGQHKDDICELRMWSECDDHDKPDDNKVLIACRGCQHVIDDHDRLYMEVPWGKGGVTKLVPGRFMLICGDCPMRKDTSCSCPQATHNGGPGMDVKFSHPYMNSVHVCFHKGSGLSSIHGNIFPEPAISCSGKGTK